MSTRAPASRTARGVALGRSLGLARAATRALDVAADRAVLPGYAATGPRLRRAGWRLDPARRDPEPGSLAGRHVVVTGATSGIGRATAVGLAGLGAVVHLLGRDPAKVAAEAADLRAQGAQVVEEVCDVGDLDAVAAWCADLLGRVDALHGLVHNAGVLTTERQESPQGHEQGLAVHVLGPHLMTALLLPALRTGRGSVLWMSSGGMYTAGLHADSVDDLEHRRPEDLPYDGVRAYARTKRMQVVLADAWARRTRGTGVLVASMHPGWVATPGLTDALPGFDRLLRPLLRDAAEGADTAVWFVATRPSTARGTFFHDRAPRPVHQVPRTRARRQGDAEARQRFLALVAEASGGPDLG
ncbi:SDR family NAD(P)-dependent oxidoreductase [Nocardioides bruguierae]|uniref:SDR family NAD(P)-dependent oxidoreductase n=1 Tax=Nocardioides bruguierae TaxID=2945102 RepID=UPI00202035FD|nr:SDR family NAD(P)-dependent oxidoreductase [Nocardioides bruguierae]MCL8026762.1 SDR family NAD(P)-dependent oxidoreductase [Nocardioides bruguierae]